MTLAIFSRYLCALLCPFAFTFSDRPSDLRAAGDGNVKENGMDCRRDAQCKSGFCHYGTNKCGNKLEVNILCNRDAQCKSGYCPFPSYKCGKVEEIKGNCKRDAQCKSGYCPFPSLRCTDQTVNGTKCFRDAQCMTGYCRLPEAICAIKSTCTDSSCGVNGTKEYCSGWGGSAKCKPQKAKRVSCTRDAQCETGYCSVFLKCESTCTDSSCGASGAKEYCSGWGGSAKCKPQVDKSAKCWRDAQCVSGYCPFPGAKCGNVTESGMDCIRDAQCKSGYCPLTSLKCGNVTEIDVDCSRDAQCKSGYCPLLSRKCTVQVGSGEDCFRDAQCESANCKYLSLNTLKCA